MVALIDQLPSLLHSQGSVVAAFGPSISLEAGVMAGRIATHSTDCSPPLPGRAPTPLFLRIRSLTASSPGCGHGRGWRWRSLGGRRLGGTRAGIGPRGTTRRAALMRWASVRAGPGRRCWVLHAPDNLACYEQGGVCVSACHPPQTCATGDQFLALANTGLIALEKFEAKEDNKSRPLTILNLGCLLK